MGGQSGFLGVSNGSYVVIYTQIREKVEEKRTDEFPLLKLQLVFLGYCILFKSSERHDDIS